MSILLRARQAAKQVRPFAARQLVMRGVETIDSVREAEPEFAEVRARILTCGTDNQEYFGTAYALEGGLSLQQDPDEFAALCLLLRRQAPRRTYLEIGSASGGACRFLQQEVGFERVLSLDDGQHPRAIEQDANFSALDDVTRFIGDSHSAEAETFLAENAAKSSIDIAFVDGDHSYEGVKQDVLMILPYCRPGALLVLHDTRACDGVEQFWLELGRRRLAKPIAELVGRERSLGIGVARVEGLPADATQS